MIWKLSLTPDTKTTNDNVDSEIRSVGKVEESLKAATNAGINLTGYHPPIWADPQANNFPLKSPPLGQLFSAKLWPQGQKNETKIPTPWHNLPS